MPDIERVTFKGAADSRAKTVWLRVTSESDLFLSGVELRADGEEVFGRGFDERQRIIDKSTIRARRPGCMDLFYGQLVVCERARTRITETR